MNDENIDATTSAIIGGVDTHKDLHVAAVVNQHNKVLGTEYFSITRQGYRKMLAWMATFGSVQLSAQAPTAQDCCVSYSKPE